MRRPLTLLRSAAIGLSAAAAVLGLSGCADQDQAAPPSFTVVPTMAPPSVDPGPLPAPDALAAVMSRLADPAVPGPAKLTLVADTGPDDAGALDRFAAALRDGGFTPITVTAADLQWAPAHQGDVLATVKITASGQGGEFAFPMEFRRNGNDWQLTRESAEMLLAFGNAQSGPPAQPPPPPPSAAPAPPTPTTPTPTP